MPDSSAGKQQDSKSEFEFPVGEEHSESQTVTDFLYHGTSSGEPCSNTVCMGCRSQPYSRQQQQQQEALQQRSHKT
jgi:hypothetical protein